MKLQLRIALLLGGLLLGGTLAISGLLLVRGAEMLAPAQLYKADRLAMSLAARIERAFELGIPPAGLQGLPEFLEASRADHPDLARIEISLPDLPLVTSGPPLPEAESAHRPIRGTEAAPGKVVVIPDPAHAARTLGVIAIDLAIILLIITLIGQELIGVILRGRADANSPAADPGAIRAPLFMFMFAHELSRPFLPAQAMALSGETGWLSPALAASLPLTAFTAVVALLQLPLATRSARWGRGRSFRIGALTGALGFGLSALATGPLGLLAAQLIAGTGFALVFVSCQGHVLDTATGAQRVAGIGTMVGAIMVAGLCGPAVGGMLAESFGAGVTFGLMALLALAALGLGWRALPVTRTAPAPVKTAPARANAPASRRPAAEIALLALMAGCALPAKILLFATCFYLIPLEMTAQGASMQEIGRLQMIYPVMTVLLIPGLSKLSLRLDQRQGFVVTGALLASLALSLPLLSGGDPAGFGVLAALLVVFGLAQALSITPQAALVGEIARACRRQDENKAYGIYRLIERGGSALGPLIGALLLPVFGFATSLTLLAGLSLAGVSVFALTQFLSRRIPPVAERAPS